MDKTRRGQDGAAAAPAAPADGGSAAGGAQLSAGASAATGSSASDLNAEPTSGAALLSSLKARASK
eukprot:9214997-Pyramimonas_sp.AAC.1